MSTDDATPGTAWSQEIQLVRPDGTTLTAHGESLYQGGLAVRVDAPLIAGEQVEVRAILPVHESHRLDPVHIDCQVRYVVELTEPGGRYRAGLTVTGISAAHRRRLIAFIRQEARRRQARRLRAGDSDAS